MDANVNLFEEPEMGLDEQIRLGFVEVPEPYACAFCEGACLVERELQTEGQTPKSLCSCCGSCERSQTEHEREEGLRDAADQRYDSSVEG